MENTALFEWEEKQMWSWVTFDGVVIFFGLFVAVHYFNNAIEAFGAMIAERRREKR